MNDRVPVVLTLIKHTNLLYILFTEAHESISSLSGSSFEVQRHNLHTPLPLQEHNA